MEKVIKVVTFKGEYYATREEIYHSFEQDMLDRVSSIVKARVVKKLFFKVLPALEGRLTREQLKTVLQDFDPYELNSFYTINVKETLQDLMNEALDSIVKRIMADVEQEFRSTNATLNNIISKIFSIKEENGNL